MAWAQCSQCGKNGDSDEMVPMGAVDYGDHEEEEYLCAECADERDEPMFALEPERPTEAEYAYFHESEEE